MIKVRLTQEEFKKGKERKNYTSSCIGAIALKKAFPNYVGHVFGIDKGYIEHEGSMFRVEAFNYKKVPLDVMNLKRNQTIYFRIVN